MGATIPFKRILLIFSPPIGLLAFLIVLVNSDIFVLNASAMSTAVILDLVLTVPALYFLLIRKTKIPKITIMPFFIAGIVIAALLIPEEHQSVLTLVKRWFLPLVEIIVFSIVVLKVRNTIRSFKAQRKQNPDFFTALKLAAQQVLPRQVAGVFAMEIAVGYYGFFNWGKRILSENEYSYHRKSGSVALYGAFIGIILVETFAMHFVLGLWSVTAAWILSILSVYTAVQLFGIARSFSKRPHVIQNDKIILRYGLFGEAEIPLDQIESVKLTRKMPKFDKTLRSLSPLAQIDIHNVIIHLRSESTLTGFYGIQKSYSTLAVFVDEVDSFRARIRQYQDI